MKTVTEKTFQKLMFINYFTKYSKQCGKLENDFEGNFIIGGFYREWAKAGEIKGWQRKLHI